MTARTRSGGWRLAAAAAIGAAVAVLGAPQPASATAVGQSAVTKAAGTMPVAALGGTKNKRDTGKGSTNRNRGNAKQRDDARRQAEARQRAEAQRRAAEARKRAEAQRRAQEARRRAEAQRRAEEARRRADAQRRAEQARRAAEARERAAAQRRVQEARQRADARRRADELRQRREAQRRSDDLRERRDAQRRADDLRRRQEAQRRSDELRRQRDFRHRGESLPQRQEAQRRANEAARQRLYEQRRNALRPPVDRDPAPRQPSDHSRPPSTELERRMQQRYDDQWREERLRQLEEQRRHIDELRRRNAPPSASGDEPRAQATTLGRWRERLLADDRNAGDRRTMTNGDIGVGKRSSAFGNPPRDDDSLSSGGSARRDTTGNDGSAATEPAEKFDRSRPFLIYRPAGPTKDTRQAGTGVNDAVVGKSNPAVPTARVDDVTPTIGNGDDRAAWSAGGDSARSPKAGGTAKNRPRSLDPGKTRSGKRPPIVLHDPPSTTNEGAAIPSTDHLGLAPPDPSAWADVAGLPPQDPDGDGGIDGEDNDGEIDGYGDPPPAIVEHHDYHYHYEYNFNILYCGGGYGGWYWWDPYCYDGYYYHCWRPRWRGWCFSFNFSSWDPHVSFRFGFRYGGDPWRYHRPWHCYDLCYDSCSVRYDRPYRRWNIYHYNGRNFYGSYYRSFPVSGWYRHHVRYADPFWCAPPVTRWRVAYYDTSYDTGGVYYETYEPLTTPIDEAWDLLGADLLFEAHDAFTRLVERRPFAGEPRIGYAITSGLLGRDGAAIEAMRRALRDEPEAIGRVPNDRLVRDQLRRLLDVYAQRVRDDFFDRDALVMVGALRLMLGEYAVGYFAVDAAIKSGDADPAAVNLRRLLEESMYGAF